MLVPQPPLLFGRQLPPIHRALAGILLVAMAIFNLSEAFRWLIDWRKSDFAIYYVASQIGWRHGWPSMYDVRYYIPREVALSGLPNLYMETPPLAWVVGPLTLLHYRTALPIWHLLMLACCLLGCWLLGRTPVERAWLALVTLAFVPTALALGYGQASTIVAVSAAAGVHFLRQGRPELAGALLAASVVKPHLAILVPFVLLMSQQWRALAAYCCVAGALAITSLLQLGLIGARYWLEAVRWTYDHGGSYLKFDTLIGTFGLSTGLALSLVVVAAIAVLGWRAKDQTEGPAVAIAGALCASLMVTTYVLPYDATVLMVAGATCWLAGAPGWLKLAMVAACIAFDLQNLVYPFPIAIFLEGGLLALLVAWQIRQTGDSTSRPRREPGHEPVTAVRPDGTGAITRSLPPPA